MIGYGLGFAALATGLIVASAFALVLFTTSVPGNWQWLHWTFVTVMVAAPTAGSFLLERRLRRLSQKEKALVPVDQGSTLAGAHHTAQLFHKTLHHDKPSAEAQEIARAGENLVQDYEDVLQAWSLLLWQGGNAEALQALQESAQDIQSSIQDHSTTLSELLQWEEARKVPTPLRSEDAPEFVAARTRQSAIYSQEALRSTQDKLRHQQEALAGLPGHTSFLQAHGPQGASATLQS